MREARIGGSSLPIGRFLQASLKVTGTGTVMITMSLDLVGRDA